MSPPLDLSSAFVFPALPIRWSEILKTGISVLFGILVLQIIYNRYFHPLRNFPGPFWGSVTDFYKLFVVAKMDAHTRGVEMHKKYGDYSFSGSSTTSINAFLTTSEASLYFKHKY